MRVIFQVFEKLQVLHFVLRSSHRLSEVYLRRYPHISLMEEVWGEKSNIIPPYVADSARPTDKPPVTTVTTYSLAEGGDLVLDDENLVEDHDQSSPEAITSENESNVDSIRDAVLIGQSSDNSLQTASKKLLKTVKKNGVAKNGSGKNITSGKSAYEEIMKQREVSFKQKMKVEEQKLDLEKERFQCSSEIERGKLELEKAKWEFEVEVKRKELAIKEAQMKNDAEIRLKELEIEQLKLLQSK